MQFGNDNLTKILRNVLIMTKNNHFFAGEDENDFMPIIPLNENDSEDKNLVIPSELPILPLRNTVLFPGVVLPITVGRDKSIKAVNEAYKSDKLIGVISQIDTNIEDPEAKDLCIIMVVPPSGILINLIILATVPILHKSFASGSSILVSICEITPISLSLI